MMVEEEKQSSAATEQFEGVGDQVEVGRDGLIHQHLTFDVEESYEAEQADQSRALTSPLGCSTTIDEQGIVNIEDHFTLPSQSSTIRFRSSVLRVFPNTNSNTQFVLETDTSPDGKTKTSMRQMNDSNAGSLFLRASYTLITIFFVGTITVFAISFILFLITDITIAAGRTSIQNITPLTAVGVFLALPVVVYGLASGLVIGGSFVSDTWQGNPLLKRYCFNNPLEVMFEWTLLFAYLGLPVMLACACLLTGVTNWWQITLMTWFSSVSALFVLYSVTISYFETKVCLTLTVSLGEEGQSYWTTLMECILLHQIATYSGYKKVLYLSRATPGSEDLEEQDILKKTYREKRSLYTRWTQWRFISNESKCCKLYQVLDEPFRLTPIAEIQGVRSVFSATSWNLEKVYCRPREDRLVAVVRGPDSITRTQLRSSLACAIVGQLLSFLLFISILVFVEAGTNTILIFTAAVLVLGIIPNMVRGLRLYKIFLTLSEGLSNNEPTPVNTQAIDDVDFDSNAIEAAEEAVGSEEEKKDNPLSSDVIYRVHDSFRLTKPCLWLSWTMFAFEVCLLFVWPLAALYRLGNMVIATVFLFMAIFAFLRRFINPAVALQEVGSIKKSNSTGDQDWRREARVSSILDNVTVNRSRQHWMLALALILIAFLVLCSLTLVATSNADNATMPDETIFPSETENYLPDFEYRPAESLSYPTCKIGKDFLAGDNETRLLDFAFLSLLAYKSNMTVQSELDAWFGDGVAVEMDDFVDIYRNLTSSNTIPVSYKLIKLHDGGPTIVTIRGTVELWDIFADAQLWSVAALMQMLRFVVPFGGSWTPIMSYLIQAISFLQSETLEKVSFYKETTAFVKFLQQLPEFDGGIGITGHSLGGGLAMITGAQTQTPAIAMSGPNSLLSRRTLTPKVSEEALHKYTFNLLPDRDLVPRIDDPARLTQNIRCTAPINNVFGCHTIERTICELMVSCGTENRPVICKCAQEYGYPEPIAMGNRTFAEACSSSSS